MLGADGTGVRRWRATGVLSLAVLCGALAFTGCGSGRDGAQTKTTSERTAGACSPGEKQRQTLRLDAGEPRARAIAQTVSSEFNASGLCSAVFGVWIGGKPVSTGAIGAAMPGVPATRNMRFRTGNVAEAFETTLMLQYVDRGKMRLDDPVAKWFPSLPRARQVTVKMLANSTSGYADFVTNKRFATMLDENPFRQWRPEQLIAFAMSSPPLFPPGKSWAFSDTNFVLLGQILEKVGGRPLPQQMRDMIYHRLHLKHTAMTSAAYIAPPVMHAYTNERGPFEDATYWNISWEPGAGNMTSDVADLGIWAQAVGRGTLLSPQSHRLQLSPETVGLGPLTPSLYYGLGVALGKGWVFMNPQVDGYSGIVAYNAGKKIAIVITTTMGPSGDINVAYSTSIFLRMARLLTPGQVPALSATPRGSKASK
jgi:D-alanyl-D-alanine carboxypeptidase